ncbi:legumin B [Morus notabilis]|uniref:legumin B n=1 Tax=Morus notabilis TaxID=981085 RepID=UPI000CED5CC4|nr:legumin B [Morus notabilis]
MASSSLLCLTLLSLVLFHNCFAQIEQMPLRSRQQMQQRKQQQRWQTECRLDRLNALQPSRRVESEAGISEYWDLENEDELQCAGVSAVRHTIHRRGLLLPFFTNAPDLTYIIQGRGIQGAVIPGCPETYESGQSQQSQRSQQQHQKVREIREGDIVAAPAGVAQWFYNNGDSPLVLVSFVDVGNQANQLDLSARRFHLGGNPQKDQRTEQEMRLQSRSRRSEKGAGERRNPNGNIFSGFDVKILAESFNIDTELARKLQSKNDRRERIVRVRDELQILSPSRIHEEERRHEYRRGYDYEEYNGMEETFCTLRMRHNIDRPSRADIFNQKKKKTRERDIELGFCWQTNFANKAVPGYLAVSRLVTCSELDDPILREVDDYAAEAGIDSVDALVDGNESGEGSLVGGEMRGFTAAFVDAPLAGMSGDPDRPIFTADVTVLRIQSRDIVRAYKDGCIDRRWFDYFLPDANFRSKCDG